MNRLYPRNPDRAGWVALLVCVALTGLLMTVSVPAQAVRPIVGVMALAYAALIWFWFAPAHYEPEPPVPSSLDGERPALPTTHRK